MARHLLTLFALTLAALHSVAAIGPSNMVQDGGFEDVPKSAIKNFRSRGGGWTLSGGALFQPYSKQSPRAPYGTKYAQLFCSQSDPPPVTPMISTASHAVAADFVVGPRYILSYASQPGWLNANKSTNYQVTFKVMLGDQVLSFMTLSNQVDYPAQWSNKTVSFSADKKKEGLQVILDCTNLGGLDDPPQQPYVYIDAFQIIAQV